MNTDGDISGDPDHFAWDDQSHSRKKWKSGNPRLMWGLLPNTNFLRSLCAGKSNKHGFILRRSFVHLSACSRDTTCIIISAMMELCL